MREICPRLSESDARVLILLVVGQLMHAVCAKEMFEEGGQSETFRVDIEGLVDHIVRFSAAGVRAYAGENGT